MGTLGATCRGSLLFLCWFFFILTFGLIALNLSGEVIVFDVLFWQGSDGDTSSGCGCCVYIDLVL